MGKDEIGEDIREALENAAKIGKIGTKEEAGNLGGVNLGIEEEEAGKQGKTRKKIGRPAGSGKTSTEIATLGETDPRAYKYLRELISYLPEEAAKAIAATKIPRKDLHSINKSIERTNLGTSSTFPLVCSGSSCPYAGRCALEMANLAPISYDCPMELSLISRKMGAYIEALLIEEGNIIEMDQVSTIVMCDMLIMRIRNYMSKRADGHIDNNAVGIDHNGNIILSRDIAKEILIEEKYIKIKERQLEALLATRESKAKFDIVEENDPSVRSAKLRGRAQALDQRAAEIEGSLPPVEVQRAVGADERRNEEGERKKAEAKRQFIIDNT